MNTKTTIELPEELLREAKKRALDEGKTFKTFYTEALQAKLAPPSEVKEQKKPWLESFGGLSDLHEDQKQVMQRIEEEFETVDEDI